MFTTTRHITVEIYDRRQRRRLQAEDILYLVLHPGRHARDHNVDVPSCPSPAGRRARCSTTCWLPATPPTDA
jgi:hypothetical protein